MSCHISLDVMNDVLLRMCFAMNDLHLECVLKDAIFQLVTRIFIKFFIHTFMTNRIFEITK